jgi:hypothetical protein
MKNKAVFLFMINALSALKSGNFQLEYHYMWKENANREKQTSLVLMCFKCAVVYFSLPLARLLLNRKIYCVVMKHSRLVY